MSSSAISICNLALSMIGQKPIRSFDEDNSRARLCSNLYNEAVEVVLSRMDWPFARTVKKLNIDADYEVEEDEGVSAYVLPPDCITPIDIKPYGSNVSWELVGSVILTPYQERLILKYTKRETNPSKFSIAFRTAVARWVSATLSGPLAGSSVSEINEMLQLFEYDLTTSASLDANIGTTHRESDDNPDLDTFNIGG